VVSLKENDMVVQIYYDFLIDKLHA
jgi:hypothetical protein